MSEQFQFHIEEYRALRSEIELQIEETRRAQRHSVIGVAAIYSWIMVSKIGSNASDIVSLVWLLPIIFPILFLVRSYGIYKRISDISKYLKIIEKKYSNSDLNGWEHYLDTQRTNYITAKLQGFLEYIFWTMLMLLTIAFGILGFNLID